MNVYYQLSVFLYVLDIATVINALVSKDNDKAGKKLKVPIHKLCSLGKVLALPNFECKDVAFGQNWTGFIYDSNTFKKRDPNSFDPNYILSEKNPSCENGEWVLLLNPVRSQEKINGTVGSSSSSIESNFILLTNGKLMWKSDKCACGKCKQWVQLNAEYFVDGLGYSVGNESIAYYSGQESHQVLYYCSGQMNDANVYTLRNDRAFVVILFLTSCVYLITVLIYGALWSSHTLPGRVLLSVVFSRMVMSFMLGLGYTGKLYRWDISSGPVTWCVIVAVCIHYFMISSYSWVAILNYDLWWTFRHNVRSSFEQKSINKHFFQYSCFGWGMPFLLTSFSVIIDLIYKNQPQINHKLVPNYGNGICFIVNCAYGIYVHLFTAMFLVPSLVFSILTFTALYKFRKETAAVRNSKHGETQSSFQLHLKLLVIMSISWIIGQIIWYFHVENDGSSGFYIRNTFLLILHWGIDLLGTSAFILVFFGCSRANLTKLEQKYEIFHAMFEKFRQFKKTAAMNKHDAQEQNSSTPLMQVQTRTTSAGPASPTLTK